MQERDRPLRPEEQKVWNRVAQTVSPRKKHNGKGAARPATQEDFAAMMRLPMPAHAQTRPVPQSLDINRDKKTRRGRVEIDSKIDLHDMTLSQAQPALQRAVIRAAKKNHHCLLVITGKGARLEGVIRRHFPDWIADASLRPLIASYAPAHIRHGGSGAWYVFLKSQ